MFFFPRKRTGPHHVSLLFVAVPRVRVNLLLFVAVPGIWVSVRVNLLLFVAFVICSCA